MADMNPRDRGGAIVLTMTPADIAFLRRTFDMVLDGIRADLSSYGHKVDDALRLYREEAAFRALLKALDTGEIVVTEHIRRVLRELAETTDRANEYDRVTAEHGALRWLCKQVGERRDDEPHS
ncbi:MAG: hypothetical protein ACTHKT_03890 [Solirubrobacterales bacterium]